MAAEVTATRHEPARAMCRRNHETCNTARQEVFRTRQAMFWQRPEPSGCGSLPLGGPSEGPLEARSPQNLKKNGLPTVVSTVLCGRLDGLRATQGKDIACVSVGVLALLRLILALP